MAVNTHGSWNIGGQWAKGGKKIKYMQTEDGMGLSRAKMRREKKKWKRDYGDLPEVDKDMVSDSISTLKIHNPCPHGWEQCGVLHLCL